MSSTILTPLATLPPLVWARRPARRLPFPLGEPGCRLLARARQGLWLGVRAAGLGPGDEVLVPAYHHGSEVEAFLRAGLECRFYEATESLAPDERELEALLGPRTRALHLIHYLGFPQDAARWRRWCDERDLLLIEDAAQAWLASAGGRPVGSSGDVTVFCLYKTFGLPDGAALVTRAPANGAVRRRRLGLISLGLEHGLWLVSRSRTLATLAERRHPRAYVPERDMALGDVAGPSAATAAVLARVVDPDAAEARRRNYRRLLELLPGRAEPAFAELPAGASPFVFPLVAEGKAQALRLLRSRRVRAIDLWASPHPSLPAERFPHAARLRATLVGLPVHQELRPGDVERVAAEALAAVALSE